MDTKQLNACQTNQTNCPFTLASGEATGEWFVGRKKILEKMEREIVHKDRVSNYHVVGLPRIGKSSLLKAFQGLLKKQTYESWLVTSYISLDQCKSAEEMWHVIGKSLYKNIKRAFKTTDKYAAFEEEMEFEEVDNTHIDYEYICAMARSMRISNIVGLVMIDEFDNFSEIASKDIIGQFRTLFSASEYGVRAVLASRRMVDRIENEIADAVDANVSTLAPIFINGLKLSTFDDDEMHEYWESVSYRIEHEISTAYKSNVEYYVGSHPFLLNLFNVNYWAEQESIDYLCEDSPMLNLNKKMIETLYDAFNWAVWRDMEKWQLLRPLILTTWGPDIEISKDEINELERYGIISLEQNLSEPIGPIRIAISRYFTEWMNLKRYILPFGDEWSKAEGNMRAIVKRFCDEMYMGDEDKMVKHLETKNQIYEENVDKRYTAKGRFNAMRDRMTKNINKYPDMSSSLIDYSDPSDLPEIFFKREWNTWFKQVFGGTWADWKDRFNTINEIRNFKSHNNQGFPKSRIDEATRYCHEVNDRIETFMQQLDS